MKTVIASLVCLIAVTCLGQAPAPKTTVSGAQPASKFEAEIHATIEAFRKAYDKGDADAIAATFTADGELVDPSGTTIRGRDAIAARFAETFAASPGATLTLIPDSIRAISPDTALEEGLATVKHTDGSPDESARYEVLHVKQDGKWLQARVRDFDDSQLTPHDRLKALDWLVGDWVDEAQDGVVFTSCAWSPDGNFLLREFRVQVAGKQAVNGTQRIGWDAASKRIKSWVFDANGSHGEQFWAEDEEGRWLIKATHTMTDGRIASATNMLERQGKDAVRWTSTDRTLGGDIVPDAEAYTLVRRPPPPK